MNAPRAYGQHVAQPILVTILTGKRGQVREETRRADAAIERQRGQMNARAYEAGRAER